MDNPIVLKRLLDISTATNYNLILGFIPAYVEVLVCHSVPILYKWWGKIMELSAKAIEGSWEYGIKILGGTAGVPTITYMIDAEKGISAFDGAKTPMVLIADPSTGKLVPTSIYGDYDITADYNSVGTDRSGTLIGTIVRPITRNGCVYELITKSSNASGAEPTWGTVPGETTEDASNNIWMCRKENIVANKGLGITLGYTLLEDGKEVYVVAYRAMPEEDIGAIVY